MKAIINPSKKTIHAWFNVSMTLFTCLLFLITPSCQKEELDKGSIIDMDLMSSSAIPKPKQGRVKDFERNIYKTVKIGDQWWMAENLNSLKYSDGTIINEVYAYNNDEINTEEYGRLYSWNAAMKGTTSEKAQGVCPVGWHVPSNNDWEILEYFLGGYLIAGGKMKEIDTDRWISPNEGATNESGFTALPAGDLISGSFENLNTGTFFWSSSTSFDDYHAAFRELSHHSGILYNCCVNPNKTDALSVRCIKD